MNGAIPVHLDSRFSLRPREVRHVFRRKVDENIVVVQGVWAPGWGAVGSLGAGATCRRRVRLSNKLAGRWTDGDNLNGHI